MAFSRLSLSSTLCLAIALLTSSATAQITITLPTQSTAQPPTNCITITSKTAAATCVTPSCPPIACPAIGVLETQPCGCPSAVPTVYQADGCCPGCNINTVVVTKDNCPTIPPPPCAVITTTNPPSCQSTGEVCATPLCVVVSTLGLGCNCSGVSTVTECKGNGCPGCSTSYVTVHAPCPTSPPSS